MAVNLQSPSRPTVVFADDHAAIHPLVSRILEPEFQLVAKVFDGQALLDAARLHRPDVLVVDISMPVLNGIEAIRQLKEQGCSCAVVFLTTDGGAETREMAMRSGAAGYVLKASAVEDLLPAVRAALAGGTDSIV